MLQNILLSLFDIDSAELITELATKLKQTLPVTDNNDFDEVLPYFEFLFSVPYSNPSRAKFIQYLPPEQLRAQIFRLARELLFHQSQTLPIVVIIEDFQWADSASVEFIQSMIETMQHQAIMLVIASRPSQDPAIESIYNSAQNILKTRSSFIELTPLSTDQTGRLLSELSSVTSLPEEIYHQIIERVAGIPLYAEEVIRSMRDEGIIFQENGHWDIKENAKLEFKGNSDTIEGLILSRFDNLDPTSRNVLKTASVIGKSFSISLLAACIPQLTNVETLSILDGLIQKGFIEKDSTIGDEYIFRNLLISEVIYGTQLKKERKELHGIAGNAIEHVYSENIIGYTDMLARHFYYSDHLEKGLHYQLLAGKFASSRFNIGQAKEYYENANEILTQISGTHSQVQEALEGLGDVLVMVGNYPNARENFEKAFHNCDSSVADELTHGASLLTKIGHTYDKQGETEKCLDHLQNAEDRLRGLNAPTELAQIYSDRGWIDFRRGRLEEAELTLIIAEKYAEEAQDPMITSSVINRLGGLYFEKNDMEKAKEYTLKSLEQRRLMGNLIGLAKSYNNLALLEWKQGEWKNALGHFEDGASIQRKLGNIEGIVIINTNMGLIRMDIGDIPEAVSLIQKAQDLANQIGHRSYSALTTLYLGKAFSINKEWEKSLYYLIEAEKLLLDLDDPEYLMDVTLDLAQTFAHTGDFEKAMAKVGSAEIYLNDLEEELQQNNRGRLQFVMGEISWCKGDFQTAADHYKDAVDLQQKNDFILEQAKSWLGLANAYWKLDESSMSLKAAEKAKSIFSQLGAKLDLNRTENLIETIASQR